MLDLSYMFVIADSHHAELHGEFLSFDLAFAELVRRASIPWDESPNRAPCGSWETCGRFYEIRHYDDSTSSWTFIDTVFVVEITAAGIKWADEFKEKAKIK